MPAIVTRFYGFGQWAFTSDEYYTVSDSLAGNYSWPFKAGYYALTSWMFETFGVSEWSARLPAVLKQDRIDVDIIQLRLPVAKRLHLRVDRLNQVPLIHLLRR